MSSSDCLMWRYIELFSFESSATIAKWKREVESGRNPRDIKVAFANEVVTRFHGVAAAQAARSEFEQRFRHGMLAQGMPEVTLTTPKEGLAGPQLLHLSPLVC